VHDPISALVFQSGQLNVDTVVIDGKIVLEGGRFTQLDEHALVREVQERALALSRRVGTHWLAKGRRLTPWGHGVTIGGHGEWGKEASRGGTGDHVARGPDQLDPTPDAAPASSADEAAGAAT
jgi:hypothetical protein